jgi:hypothetical protein
MNTRIESSSAQLKDFFAGSVYRDLQSFAATRILLAHDLLSTSGLDERKADEIRGAISAYKELVSWKDVLLQDDETEEPVKEEEK